MKILPVTYTTNSNIKYTKTNNCAYSGLSYNPSFKSFDLGTILGKLLLINGAGKVFNNIKHLKIKRKLMEDYIKSVCNIELEQSVPVNLLFRLSKMPAINEPNGFFDMYYKKNNVFPSIRTIRDCALKDIFPLIKEMPNDANHGHAAKVSMLESMAESGEYINSVYFYKTFCNLPKNYEKNKVVILEKMMNDPFYLQSFEEYCKKFGDKDSSFKSGTPEYMLSMINAAISALVSSISRDRNPEFFKINKGKLARCEEMADLTATEHLFRNDKPNSFYKLYAGGLTKTTDSFYVQSIIDKFYLDKISKLNNDIPAGAKFFDVSEKYFEDMANDFKALSKAAESNGDFWEIINQRVKEKLNSDDKLIRESAIGFLDSSGLAKEYLNSQNVDNELRNKLNKRIKEAPNRYNISKHRGNYRYDDEQSYININKQKEVLSKIEDKEETRREIRSTVAEHMWEAANAI